jgi:hypothetical protein
LPDGQVDGPGGRRERSRDFDAHRARLRQSIGVEFLQRLYIQYLEKLS